MATGGSKSGITIEGTDRIISLFTYLKGELPKTANTLGKVAKSTTDSMKKNAPVDTGFLRGNIVYSISGTKAEIESQASYSGFVNYGTNKMAARAFFSDAVEFAAQQLRKTMFDDVKRDIMSK